MDTRVSCCHMFSLSSSGSQTNPHDFREFLFALFPKLREGGGFELLKISGSTRSRQLSLIPCPNEGYYVKHLKDAQTQLGHATIFIRPLQRNLTLEPVSSSFKNWSHLKNADFDCYIDISCFEF